MRPDVQEHRLDKCLHVGHVCDITDALFWAYSLPHQVEQQRSY
jgi:hypothetical protein